jgi:O-antigen ligase
MIPLLSATHASRLGLLALCALAISVSLGVALVSLSKVLVVLALLASLPLLWRNRSHTTFNQSYWSPWLILIALAWMSLTYLWTAASPAEASTALARHARLLVFPVTLLLLPVKPHARTVLKCLVLGQLFVLVCSWLMFFGIALPWARSDYPTEMGILFSSTLEQPIMSTLMLIVVWHLHSALAPSARSWMVWALVLLTIANVFFVMTGRSGYVAMFLAIAMAVWLPSNRKLRGWGVLAVVLLALGVGSTSTRLQTRVQEVRRDVIEYSKGHPNSSQGIRLDYWNRSLQALSEKPWLGHGVGSWKAQYIRLGGADTIPPSNPHNQYLLWAVEGGLIGLALMIGILIALYRDARQLETPVQRAMLSTLAVVTVTSLFNCPFFGAGMGEFYLLMFGVFLAMGRKDGSQTAGSSSV